VGEFVTHHGEIKKKEVEMNYRHTHLSRLPRCLLTVFVLFSLLFVWGAACSAPQVPSEPPVSSEPPPVPPASLQQTPPVSSAPQPIAWAADGVVSSGEYTNVNTYGDYEINWRSDEKNIYIGLKVKTSGWVALGIQPGLMMKNADIVLGYVNDGKTNISDQYSTGNFGPHQPDTELGGNNDILDFGGQEVGGYTTIEFKRALDTGDQYDHPLLKGVNKIIWAYGSDDQSKIKHVSRGYGELDL
jgi:hypothetical protein